MCVINKRSSPFAPGYRWPHPPTFHSALFLNHGWQKWFPHQIHFCLSYFLSFFLDIFIGSFTYSISFPNGFPAQLVYNGCSSGWFSKRIYLSFPTFCLARRRLFQEREMSSFESEPKTTPVQDVGQFLTTDTTSFFLFCFSHLFVVVYSPFIWFAQNWKDNVWPVPSSAFRPTWSAAIYWWAPPVCCWLPRRRPTQRPSCRQRLLRQKNPF